MMFGSISELSLATMRAFLPALACSTIIKLGRYVLYEVNDDDLTCRVLAVVGQGQKPRDMFE